ncbi:MAG: hypothetical protein JWQ35_2002 [Bacteriovoracaceae bacterium]|nr:hypothetical protein [Bacteriovoracaceae bacterium]
MKTIGAYFQKEQRRLQFYRALSITMRGVLLALVFYQAYLGQALFFEGLTKLRPHLAYLPYFSFTVSFVFISICALLKIRKLSTISLSRVGEIIEKQTLLSSSKKNRGELRSVGHFLDGLGSESESNEFRDAHIQYWNRRLPKVAHALFPTPTLIYEILLVFIALMATAEIKKTISQSLPAQTVEWTPTSFEIRSAFEGSTWKRELGAVTGIQGSFVRFASPSFGSFQTFIYIKELGRPWIMSPCQEYCEWTLRERGQYAIGTLFSRSSLFPLQVIPDEAPRGVLFVKVNGEYTPSATIQALNQDKLEMQLTASDDIRLVKVELRHRLPTSDAEEKVMEWEVNDSHLKKDFFVSLTGWKGGQHQLYLRMYDQFKSSDSSPVSILFADEETMRAKRIADLKSLLDEWVHVLADLLESDHDQKLAEGLLKRLEQIQYPDVGEPSMMNAFVKELTLLGERIKNWAKYDSDFTQAKDLIQRTEKEILYGLSLVFQEKTGEIEATSDSLKSSQNQLSSLLDKIKKGELSPNSKELDEAFQKLAQQLEELQKKIRELPNGPSDELINREALEAQVEESETLAKKIEDIKKQMALGDNKGAMRELESLLNQLSILSKEMERSLDQWKSNLDQGAIQSAERFTKKLDEIRKKQEALAKKTEVLKEKQQSLEAQNSKTWKPIQPEKIEALQKEFNDLKKGQDKIGQEFESSTEEFDKDLKGTEWEQMFRSEETKQNEKEISNRMTTSKQSLGERKGFDALTNQKEAIELIKKAMESQKKMQDQVKSAAQGQSQGKETREKVELLATESKVEKERRRKIMESMQRKVEDRFQKSHEQYFEEMLQR